MKKIKNTPILTESFSQNIDLLIIELFSQHNLELFVTNQPAMHDGLKKITTPSENTMTFPTASLENTITILHRYHQHFNQIRTYEIKNDDIPLKFQNTRFDENIMFYGLAHLV